MSNRVVTSFRCRKHNFKIKNVLRSSSGPVVYIFVCFRCGYKHHLSAWNFWYRKQWHPSYGTKES